LSYNFAPKKDHDTILNYEFLTDDNHTFALAPWTDDARSFTERWSVPVIEIHGIPPHAFHASSLNALLDPHCDVENYVMDKKAGI
jgi:hypothetical protein